MPRRNKREGKTTRRPLAAHRGFAPLLGLWGAVVGALLVMVLPAALIQTALDGTLLGTFAGIAQPLAAAIAAVVLSTVLFAPALAAHGRARRLVGGHAIARNAVRQVTPINPVRDLGSRKLDDPVETMPFASPAWRDADFDAAKPALVDAPPLEGEPEAAPAPAVRPRDLDLAAFAELPGRNGVWVEDQPVAAEPTTAAAPVVPLSPLPSPPARIPAPPPAPGTAALARLRSVPAEALSLPQMVERFAGALVEHRKAPTAGASSAAELAAREAALAEALKALAALSGDTAPGDGAGSGATEEEPLRAALARIRPLREAGRGAG